jgi:hypothetical protein
MNAAARLALFAWLASGCGPRTLDLSLSIDPSCAISVPAGGSVLYELASGSVDSGATPQLCGGCVAVGATITDASTLLALLRAQAPACAIARDTTLTARVSSFATPTCAPSSGSAGAPLCSSAAPITTGDGRSDQDAKVSLACGAVCETSTCTPLSCEQQEKNCGALSDGCGNTLSCGTCQPPQKCGGAGVPNVCGKP